MILSRLPQYIGISILTFILLLVTQQKVNGQSPAYTYHITKTTDHIMLDGDLSESVWQSLPKTSVFTRNYPIDTGRALARTQIMLCYDDRNIYVAAICHDSINGKYVVESLKRDFSYPKTDAVAVFINPFNDQTNGFSFAVNPYGSQREGLVANGGTFGVTTSWDNKWYSKVKRIEGQWIAEIAIPFKSLRYKASTSEWNINFGRQDLKLNESSTWVRVPRGFNVANLAYHGKLIWDQPPPKPGANIAIIPYGISRLDIENDNPPFDRDIQFDMGLDAKVAIGSALNLDVTVNPDFSQADVDQQVINLDRFSIFFPEKRTFFLENSDLFANFGFSSIRPFFSRRIGLRNGQTVPILGGLRLSGNLNDKLRVGLMNIQTEGVEGLAESQNYLVGAFQHKVLKRSNIAAILVNRQAFSDYSAIKGDFNTVAGLDFNINSADDRIKGKVYYHQSFQEGNPGDAISQALWLQYSDAKWYLAYNHEYVGRNYRADVGFVPRTNFIRFEPIARRNFYPKGGKINRYQIDLYQSYYLDKDFDMLDRVIKPAFLVYFENQSGFEIFYRDLHTKLVNSFNLIGEGEPLPPGEYNYRNVGIAYESNFRKPFAFFGQIEYGSFFNGEKLSYEVDLRYRITPWGSISVSLERNHIDLPEPYSDADLTFIGLENVITLTTNLFWTTFLQYNTQADNINLNSRIQWRYKPLSDLFVVYTDNYDTDVRSKNRSLVIKLNYWFN
ncbi:MAG: carbohydrate binding family 9 domain-containing protein, partial [Chitinophagales bacterium]|nr:carbohydrate binding family 9 domain-containing protein [Chitinophagales bacterium]